MWLRLMHAPFGPSSGPAAKTGAAAERAARSRAARFLPVVPEPPGGEDESAASVRAKDWRPARAGRCGPRAGGDAAVRRRARSWRRKRCARRHQRIGACSYPWRTRSARQAKSGGSGPARTACHQVATQEWHMATTGAVKAAPAERRAVEMDDLGSRLGRSSARSAGSAISVARGLGRPVERQAGLEQPQARNGRGLRSLTRLGSGPSTARVRPRRAAEPLRQVERIRPDAADRIGRHEEMQSSVQGSPAPARRPRHVQASGRPRGFRNMKQQTNRAGHARAAQAASREPPRLGSRRIGAAAGGRRSRPQPSRQRATPFARGRRAQPESARRARVGHVVALVAGTPIRVSGLDRPAGRSSMCGDQLPRLMAFAGPPPRLKARP